MEPFLQAGSLMDVFGTAFLPDTGYLHLFVNASNPVIDVGEHWIKQTQRNRAIILSSNGPLGLTIPLRKKESTSHTPVMEMEISYTENWQDKSLKAIRSAYKNSPYYEHFQQEFEDLLMQKTQLLYLYNHHLMEWLFHHLYIEKHIHLSETYIEEGITKDYRKTKIHDGINSVNLPVYKQVFSHRLNFVPGLSVIDLLFNKGPESLPFLGIKKEA